MKQTTTMVLALAGVMLVAGTADAQGRGRGRSGQGVPPGHLPPAGACRIWIDGVPPGRQPAPTDCATAERTRPSNARVIYGTDARRRAGDDDDDRRRGKHEARRNRDDDKRRDRDRDDDDDDDDRRRDGRRVDRRAGDNTCVDNDRNGRCDYDNATVWGSRDRRDDGTVWGSDGRKGTLPQMIGAAVLQRGAFADRLGGWTGTRPARATWLDRDRNDVPERITWLDAGNRVVQVWFDDDADGRADRVGHYQGGRLVRVERP